MLQLQYYTLHDLSVIWIVKEIIVNCLFLLSLHDLKGTEQRDGRIVIFGLITPSSCECITVYPCPLFSVRFRKPLFGETGHTIMNLLAVRLLLYFISLVSTCLNPVAKRHFAFYRISVTTSTRYQWWRGWWWTWKWGRHASRYPATVTMRWMETC